MVVIRGVEHLKVISVQSVGFVFRPFIHQLKTRQEVVHRYDALTGSKLKYSLCCIGIVEANGPVKHVKRVFPFAKNGLNKYRKETADQRMQIVRTNQFFRSLGLKRAPPLTKAPIRTTA